MWIIQEILLTPRPATLIFDMFTFDLPTLCTLPLRLFEREVELRHPDHDFQLQPFTNINKLKDAQDDIYGMLGSLDGRVGLLMLDLGRRRLLQPPGGNGALGSGWVGDDDNDKNKKKDRATAAWQVSSAPVSESVFRGDLYIPDPGAPLTLGQALRRLASCTTRQCTQPEDRLYGLLGLISEKQRSQIEVFYDKTKSEIENKKTEDVHDSNLENQRSFDPRKKNGAVLFAFEQALYLVLEELRGRFWTILMSGQDPARACFGACVFLRDFVFRDRLVKGRGVAWRPVLRRVVWKLDLERKWRTYRYFNLCPAGRGESRARAAAVDVWFEQMRRETGSALVDAFFDDLEDSEKAEACFDDIFGIKEGLMDLFNTLYLRPSPYPRCGGTDEDKRNSVGGCGREPNKSCCSCTIL